MGILHLLFILVPICGQTRQRTNTHFAAACDGCIECGRQLVSVLCIYMHPLVPGSAIQPCSAVLLLASHVHGVSQQQGAMAVAASSDLQMVMLAA
jgi:hypothetical protein